MRWDIPVRQLAETLVADCPFGTDDVPTMAEVLPIRDGDPSSREGRHRRTRRRPPATRRGRLPRDSRLRALQAALRQINSAWELSQSPLAQYRDLQQLGRTRFPRQAFPEGWAVQAVLRAACARVERALDPRKGEFLRRWVAGESIAGIGASAGMSRSHLSRRWRPQVLAAIDAEISNLLRELRTTGGRLVHEASESSQGPSLADGASPLVGQNAGGGARARADRTRAGSRKAARRTATLPN